MNNNLQKKSKHTILVFDEVLTPLSCLKINDFNINDDKDEDEVFRN